jgi:hypothetical protein
MASQPELIQRSPHDLQHRRDEIWKAAWNTHYLVYFDEMLSDALVKRWMRIDDLVKIATAVTAGGSVIAGWTLWNQPSLKVVWAVLAGFGAVCAIVHTALGVSYRLKDYTECKNRLIRLRIELETFHIRMAVDAEFPVDEFHADLLRFRERWSNECFKRNDVLATLKLRTKLRNELLEERKQTP